MQISFSSFKKDANGILVSCRPLFQKLGILPLPSLYVLECLCFIHQYRSRVTTFSEVHSYSTRFKNNVVIPCHKTKQFENSDLYVGTKLFNVLPQAVKDIASHNKFRNELKKMMTGNVFYSLEEFFVFFC